jgi:outer membrane protein OmpA-like peptidoglycan-associated protein
MAHTIKRILCSVFALASIIFLSLPSFGQTDSSVSPSLKPSNDLATGHSYVGIDLGVTGSDYIGAKNFLWGIVTGPTLATYLPFTNLGSGVGFVGGAKVGWALSHAFDLEAKFRFMTNYASRQESFTGLYLDPNVPTAVANATSNYSVLLSSVDAALLGHLRISNHFYAAGGFSLSELTKNGFSASQQLSGGYVNQINQGYTPVTSQQTPEEQLVNWFYGNRLDAQVGAGSVFRLGASNMLLDVELLVSIPFTQWLTSVADSSLKATATYWTPRGQTPPAVTPAITDPHLWYATLTVGLRLPFQTLPPPIVDIPPAPLPVLPSELVVETHLDTTSAGIMLSGRVTDAKTGQPIAADMTAVDLSNNNVISKTRADSNGHYSVRVNGPGKYSVTANSNGYLFGSAYFEVDSQGRVLKNPVDIALSSLTGGRTRLLIFFEFDKADLQAASAPELHQAVEMMKSVPTLKVEIAGYSDSLGTLSHNLDLSLRRANAVRDFLIQAGIAAGRITAQGYGPASPIAPNATEEGRAANRRVEFVVKEH